MKKVVSMFVAGMFIVMSCSFASAAAGRGVTWGKGVVGTFKAGTMSPGGAAQTTPIKVTVPAKPVKVNTFKKK